MRFEQYKEVWEEIKISQTNILNKDLRNSTSSPQVICYLSIVWYLETIICSFNWWQFSFEKRLITELGTALFTKCCSRVHDLRSRGKERVTALEATVAKAKATSIIIILCIHMQVEKKQAFTQRWYNCIDKLWAFTCRDTLPWIRQFGQLCGLKSFVVILIWNMIGKISKSKLTLNKVASAKLQWIIIRSRSW